MFWNCGGFGLWWIFPLIFGGLWLTAIALFALRARWWWRGGPPAMAADAPSVLRERFARGEIDADEYHRRLRVLQDR